MSALAERVIVDGMQAVVLACGLALVCGCGGSSPRTPISGHASSASVVAVPGPCVDAAADAGRRLAEVTAPLGDVPLAHDDAPDLDGDGTRDRMFSAGAGVTTNTALYVVRGTCAHFVGDVGQAPERSPTAARHHGLIDLRIADTVACEGARCGCEPGELWFRFDGTAYQLDEAASRHGAAKSCPGE